MPGARQRAHGFETEPGRARTRRGSGTSPPTPASSGRHRGRVVLEVGLREQDTGRAPLSTREGEVALEEACGQVLAERGWTMKTTSTLAAITCSRTTSEPGRVRRGGRTSFARGTTSTIAPAASSATQSPTTGRSRAMRLPSKTAGDAARSSPRPSARHMRRDAAPRPVPAPAVRPRYGSNAALQASSQPSVVEVGHGSLSPTRVGVVSISVGRFTVRLIGERVVSAQRRRGENRWHVGSCPRARARTPLSPWARSCRLSRHVGERLRRSEAASRAADREGHSVRRRRDAAGSRRQVRRAGRDADDGRAAWPTASRGKTACSRASRPTRVSGGTRSPRARGRVSTAPRTTRSSGKAKELQQPLVELRGNRDPAGRHAWRRPRSVRGRRSSPSSGCRARYARPCRARSSTSVPSSRLEASLVNYDVPGQPAGASAFGVSYQRTGAADNQGPPASPAYSVPAIAERSAGRTSPRRRARRSRRNSGCGAPPATTSTRLFDLFIYDTAGSSAGYDHVLVVPSTRRREERRSPSARTSPRANGRTSRSR